MGKEGSGQRRTGLFRVFPKQVRSSRRGTRSWCDDGKPKTRRAGFVSVGYRLSIRLSIGPELSVSHSLTSV